MRKKEEEMKTWMRKPKKALDIYRLAISTIFIFIPVLLVALYSIILIKLKKQAHPGEQSANAEEQRTRRNRNVLKMAIAIVLAFFHWTPYVINELISLCLLTFMRQREYIKISGKREIWGVSGCSGRRRNGKVVSLYQVKH
ncbi:unnamed protein product [Porites evermanni]|uniref:G-protein coupled receptors family 1 profile domain-containing protein n=1 Tax=Porites evermanni TaxID=104178 RepID=A0ABN8STQ9_9CNID|nr:unnamed protein product [Porites evermanni]